MKRLLLPLFALGILLLSGCQPTTDDGTGPIQIGALSPLTGDAAALGVDAHNGVRLAVDEINAAGGINGRIIELTSEDGRCSGTEAASAVQKLININHVIAIIGGLCSGETLAAAPFAESAQVVLLSPASSSPDITNAGDFVFRNYPSDALKTKSMAALFAERGFSNVAIVTENTDYAQALRASLVDDLPEGSAPVFDEVFDAGTKDYRSLLTRLQSVDFDVLVSNANSDALNALIVQQFRELGFTQPIVGADTMDSSVVSSLGEVSEGVLIVDVDTVGKGTDFEDSFIAKYGQPQSNITWAAYGYDAMNLLAEAIAAVGTDGPAIRDYLYSATYDGIVGKFSFDDNGDPVGISYVLKVVQDGDIVTVKPLPVQ